jgi:ubiquitin C
MAAFFVAVPVDLVSATRSPRWGCTLVYLSWFLLVLLSYLLLVSFHEDYRCAIVPVLLLFFAALLRGKLRRRPSSVRQQNTTAASAATDSKPADEHLDSGGDDAGDQDLENIFEWSAGVVNCGGLISMILGHYMYMVGMDHHNEVSVIGYFFFFTVVLGLYLMMVTTVRNVELTLYVEILALAMGFLLVGTLILTFIQGVWISRNGSHV